MAGEGAGEEESSSSSPKTGSKLKQRLTSLYDGDIVLKYQLISEDLDALVSVRNDEDLKHMLDEYDRQENEGTPRLRTFLFPSKPTILDNQAKFFESHALEQCYVDAINGIIRRPKLTPIDVNPSSFSISSACSSPNSPSPELHTVESVVHETNLNGYQNSRVTMHKVQSSPSLCSLDNFQHHSNHNVQQQHYYHYYGSQNQHHHYGYQSCRPPIDLHRGLAPALSMGRAEMGRSMMGHGPGHYHTNSHKNTKEGVWVELRGATSAATAMSLLSMDVLGLIEQNLFREVPERTYGTKENAMGCEMALTNLDVTFLHLIHNS
ncbi:hypothetical protein FNV43_RR06459 [Rhamnella rubrinervis]|uniref:PB1 domain-containing protein n=1 Tax=Rhamnella rubrinervis TaxID=2594499 RepID=A0A8K0MLF1_9ROSA|nr:hypothetical protein FNV43_RR06459 [Rhamnella rubrinervis]